jgi:hypothetical protein
VPAPVLTYRFFLPDAPDEVSDTLIQTTAPTLGSMGWRLTFQTKQGLTFQRSYRPWWVYVLCVLLFPIGLAFLIVTRIWTLSLAFRKADEGTEVTLTAPDQQQLRQLFAGIGEPVGEPLQVGTVPKTAPTPEASLESRPPTWSA